MNLSLCSVLVPTRTKRMPCSRNSSLIRHGSLRRIPVLASQIHRRRSSGCNALSGSSGKSRGYWRASDAGLAAWTVSAAMSPAEGVTMGVPVDSCLRNRIGDILPSLEALPGQRQ